MAGRETAGIPAVVSDTAWTWSRALAYLLIAAAGAAVLAHPPRTYQGISLGLTLAWGVLLLVPGVVAAAGMIWRRYVWEWVAVYLVAAGLGIYAALSWQTALHPGGEGNLPRALLVTGFMVLLIARACQLHMDDRRARLAVLARQEVTD